MNESWNFEADTILDAARQEFIDTARQEFAAIYELLDGECLDVDNI